VGEKKRAKRQKERRFKKKRGNRKEMMSLKMKPRANGRKKREKNKTAERAIT